jgi:PAS domain S-box-containing protein
MVHLNKTSGMKAGTDYLMEEKGSELFAKLFQNSGEGIMFFNQHAEIQKLNPRAMEMFGYDEEELFGKPVEILVPKGAKKKHEQYRNQYIQKPSPRQMGVGRDLEGVRKDGSTFPIEISLNYIKLDNDTTIVAFITDITIRKKSEKVLFEQQKKLEEYNLELERMVKMRTSELEHTNLGLQSQVQERKLAENALKKSLEDLKKAEQEILKSLEKEKELGELKSRFVSMASHEFRTPLTTILSSANLIQKYETADQQDSREKHVGRIKNSVRNLTSILNDFLSLEKLESGIQNVDRSDVNLDKLVHELIDDMTLKNNQRITFDSSKINLYTDRHILMNVLINLLSNASKYSKEGDEIMISAETTNNQIAISIKDSGIGIPKSEQKNMFERFFRAGNVTNIQGTGLGLNIVQKYVGLLNGEISFVSEEGKGSTFHVMLPK